MKNALLQIKNKICVIFLAQKNQKKLMFENLFYKEKTQENSMKLTC